jgi:hypothetical protein
MSNVPSGGPLELQHRTYKTECEELPLHFRVMERESRDSWYILGLERVNHQVPIHGYPAKYAGDGKHIYCFGGLECEALRRNYRTSYTISVTNTYM